MTTNASRAAAGVLTLAMMLLWAGATDAETVQYQIAASADDTHCGSVNNYVGNSTTYCPYNTDADRRPFFRWALNIPCGATIESAYFRLKAYSTSTATRR